MTSGGARARSGPPPDPNALRRDRKTDLDWLELPSTGRHGNAPAWPLQTRMRAGELGLWRALWRKPQATQWEPLGLHMQVASYVRAYLESMEPEAPASLKTAVLRMQEDLGLSLAGLARHRWRISQDEVSARRRGATNAKSMRERLKAVKSA